MYLGDVYEHGTAQDFAHNYEPVYDRFDRITAPTPGNHDWPDHAEGYDPYWRRERGGRAMAPYYAFRIGGWQILSINSEQPHDTGSSELTWLRSRLRAPGTCRIAFWHRPRFSAGKHGDQADMAPVWDALRGHAAIVLNGHDHDMQRLRPIDGITELVAGAGGKSSYRINRGDPRLAFADDTDDGALRLTLSPGRARIAFFAVNGRKLDSDTIDCHPG